MSYLIDQKIRLYNPEWICWGFDEHKDTPIRIKGQPERGRYCAQAEKKFYRLLNVGDGKYWVPSPWGEVAYTLELFEGYVELTPVGYAPRPRRFGG